MSNNSSAALNTPIVEDGLHRIPFFNGRVLTAEDLQTEQQANVEARSRLGRALGTGILEGLYVRRTGEDATLTVESGLALAPSGRLVHLPQSTDVSVVSKIDREETAGTGGRFADCSSQEVVVTSGTGAYILVVEPAAEPRGRTPKTRVGGDGAAGECGAQYLVEGAKLRLVHLSTADSDLIPQALQTTVRTKEEQIDNSLDAGERPAPQNVSMLRSSLAHACLCTSSALEAAADLHGALTPQSRGKMKAGASVMDALRKRAQANGSGLGDAVPVGLFYWAQDHILFADTWSVRRRIHRPDTQAPMSARARRRAETEASILQFQDQLADYTEQLSRAQRDWLEVREWFEFLPPAGTIPIEKAAQAGFRPAVFFEGLTTRDPLFVEGTDLQPLFNEALSVGSLAIHPDRLLWQYYVREDAQSSSQDKPSFVVFSNGFVPEIADPQYNVSRWNYSNYGPVRSRR